MNFNFNNEFYFSFKKKSEELKPSFNICFGSNHILREQIKKPMPSGVVYKQNLLQYEEKSKLVLSLVTLYKNIDPSYIVYFVDLAYSEAPLENPEMVCELAIKYIERYRKQKGETLSDLISSYNYLQEGNKDRENKIISKIRSYNINEFVLDFKFKDRTFPYNCVLDKLAKKILKKGNLCDSLISKYEKGLKVLNQTNFLTTKGCLFHVLSKLFNINDFQKILLTLLKLEEYEYGIGEIHDILVIKQDAILVNVSRLCQVINIFIEKELIEGCGNDEAFSMMKVADSSTTHFLIVSHLDNKIYDPYGTLRKYMIMKEDLSIEYVWTFNSYFKRTI